MIVLIKVAERIEHNARFLGACRVVKIDERMSINILMQNWKLRANLQGIECATVIGNFFQGNRI